MVDIAEEDIQANMQVIVLGKFKWRHTVFNADSCHQPRLVSIHSRGTMASELLMVA